MIINGNFYIDSKKCDILKGDSRFIIKDTYFLAPQIETNIYKNNIVLNKFDCIFNKLIIKISENGFFTGVCKKTNNDLIIKFTYKSEFIIFKLQTRYNIICQREAFTTPLPLLKLSTIENMIKNKYFDFKIYKERD